jgi:uncharacterized lipoprotein YmbA
MDNVSRCVVLALAGLALWLAGCVSDPNVRPRALPSAEKLRAADCAPALVTYRQLLQLPPRVGMVVTNRSAKVRSAQEQERAAQDFATQCASGLVDRVRRAILRCWSDSPDTETFQNCSLRF